MFEKHNQPFGKIQAAKISGRNGAHKLKKNRWAGTPAGCLSDTRRDKQRPMFEGLPVVYHRKTDRKFCRDASRVSQDTRPSRGFSETFCDFFLCALVAP